ncbi:MAG: hypothetical protein IPK82_24575 [Polyangiaceae bacterium]|nr:hypothetical protein [Polyangiaceae bacterium]
MRALMPAFDCIQEYEQARSERLWDGMSLWATNRDPGAVYVLGYAAEIAVKCAYFRFSGFTIVQPIGHAELNTAQARAHVLHVTAPREGFHSIRFWGDLLIEHRRAAARPLPAATEASLKVAVDAVYDRWWIEMRYKRAYSSRTDLEQLAAAVDWIDNHYVALYT